MTITRRTALTGLAAGAAAATGWAPFIQAQSAEPIRIGFQLHRTGVGASYGRWFDRVTQAAAARINEEGGINGRPIEIIAEDDGTDPKRGAEIVEKLATQRKCDIVYGTLFSDVVTASAPRAAELKIPYFVVSEGTHVPSGSLNRWTIQPGITDVRSQAISMAPYIAGNLGKKITMIYPDYEFGHDHRDNLPAAIAAEGGEVIAGIAISPTETSFFRYFPQIPAETDVLYHVMVGPNVLTFVKELGDFYGSGPRPEIFGFIDTIEAVDLNSPGLEFLDGTYFWECMPRYASAEEPEPAQLYRKSVGVDENGAAIDNPKEVSTYSHMFGCWETLHVIKAAMEAADYQGPADRQAVIEAVEAMSEMPLSIEHPQGPKLFVPKMHQVFGQQHVSRVEDGVLKVLHTTSIEDGLYESDTNYLTRSF